MKIITPGREMPPPPESWWIGQRLTCPNCGAELELEATDLDSGRMRSGQISLSASEKAATAEIVCPTEYCKTVLKVQSDAVGISEPTP